MPLLLFTYFFLSSIAAKTLTGLDCIYEYHGGRLIRSRNCLPFMSTWVHLWVFGEVRIANIFLVFCVILLCVFTLLVPYNDVRYDFRIKTMLGLSLPPLVCRRLIYFICVCLRIVVSNTYCVVFLVLFVFVLCIEYPMLPVSLDCPFLIASPVFSKVYLLSLRSLRRTLKDIVP